MLFKHNEKIYEMYACSPLNTNAKINDKSSAMFVIFDETCLFDKSCINSFTEKEIFDENDNRLLYNTDYTDDEPEIVTYISAVTDNPNYLVTTACNVCDYFTNN